MTIRQKIRADTVVVQASGMVSADMDGQWVMMNIENGNYYSLDPVGSRIWELVEKPLTVNGLVDALLTEYKVEKEQCRANVSDFLEQMIEKGLVATV